MKQIKEIGLEREVFLLQNGKIMEPAEYGFAYDEMGFLVEERSEPWRHLNTIQMTLEMQHMLFTHRAKFFGMSLVMEPVLEGPKDQMDYIADKYKIHDFTDYTQNVYGHSDTHHLGIFPLTKDSYRLTAGIHVHFSSRTEHGRVVELPIEDIVRKMDERFHDSIVNAGRLPGEWEPKPHGFEYRSLPCNMDILEVLQIAFKILREV